MSGIKPLTARASTAPTYTGHNSWHALTTSNGLGAAMFSTKGNDIGDANAQPDHAIVRFQPHIYSHYDAKTTTRNYMWDAYFGYGVNGGGTKWLNTTDIDSAKYVNGTNIINVDQLDKDKNLQFSGYYFTPFSDTQSGKDGNQSRTLVMLMKVTNTDSKDQNVSVFSMQNMHMGTGDSNSDNEGTSYNSDKNYLKEYNTTKDSKTIAIYKSLNQSDNEYYQAGTGDNNPWVLGSNGKDFANYSESSGNDLAAGFENKGASLAPGQSKWYGLVIGLDEDGDETSLSNDVEKLAQAGMNDPEKLLTQEEANWTDWHSPEKVPSGLSDNEKQIYSQSTAVLRMAQNREQGDGYGQILASLIPGEWSIAWPRDGNYSLQALNESGHYQEAKAGLQFLFNAKMRKAADGRNFYQENYIENKETSETSDPTYGKGYGLGLGPLSDNYLISVCRYFGNGEEDSDINENGYNIELDGWGLSLWTADQYVTATGDTQFLKDNWDKLKKRDANLLVELMDPSTNLIAEDSSIWEEHWTPFNILDTAPARQHFAYTNITAYQGLKSAAHMAELAGDKTAQATFSYKAGEIKKAVLKNLVIDNKDIKTIASSTERKAKGYNFNDASTVEAINFGMIAPQDYLATGMIDAFDNNLQIKTGSTPGYMRDQDGSWYDSREWGFIDQRIAGALAKMGRYSDSKKLMDWMTSNAAHNYDLIPELLQSDSQDYAGSVPMAGFGSGSYILGLNDYYGQKENEAESAAADAVSKANSSKSQSDVNAARTLVSALPDGDLKTNLTYQLDTLQKAINDDQSETQAEKAASSAVAVAVASQKQSDLDAARELVNKLGNSTVKNNLNGQLDALQKTIDSAAAEKAAVAAVAKAEASLSQTDLDAASTLVNKLPSSNLKTQLLGYLAKVQQTINQKAEPSQPTPDKNPEPTKDTPAPAKNVLFTGYLTKSHAIRTGGLTTAPIIGHLSKGAAVQVLSTGKWTQIRYNGKDVYVYGDVSKTRPVLYTGYLTQKHAVRTGASTHKPSVAKLSAGKSVQVLKAGKSWTLIRYKEANRYVWAKDVKKAKYTGKLTKKHALRSSYSVKSHVKKWLSKGTKVKVLSQGKHWNKVVYKGKLGYVWNSGIRK
jgi:GH15 family glucan-1,4-alpha-glucosidase